MGKLTTHVLDTARGLPCAGMAIALFRVRDEGTQSYSRTLVCEVRSNADGRCDAPLLQGADLQQGEYELVFAAGEYFTSIGVELPQPPFVDKVSLRFGVADPTASYHVPLLVSPWSYSTYRGS